MTEPIYIDEQGNRINPAEVGTNYEIDNGDKSKQPSNIPHSYQPNMINQMIQEERVNNFISQTSPTATLESINYILQGFIFDSSKKEWIKISNGIPESIRLDFLQFITPDLSENLRMTNLNKDQINGVMLTTIEWVVDYLDIKADTDNLTEEQMSKIAFIMIKSVFYTLLRSQEGIERSKIFKSLSLGGEINPIQQNQEKRKFWQFWK